MVAFSILKTATRLKELYLILRKKFLSCRVLIGAQFVSQDSNFQYFSQLVKEKFAICYLTMKKTNLQTQNMTQSVFSLTQ